ncbi:phytanoyl-CoA dioxygenase family protein [Burkholderiales bacterium]|nr:phytanoyl-CoA dioxygenase family protein [Burkholderiales bacterium]
MTNQAIELKDRGFTLFRQVFDTGYVDALSAAMDRSYDVCRTVQVANGVQEITDGTVHHLLATGDPIYVDLLEKICSNAMKWFIQSFFQGKYILNSYGGVINLTAKPSYVANIHRDTRFFTGDFPLMLNMLIMLDDFTLENGATYLLEGSHHVEAKPDNNHFYAQSARATGKRGDILFFNSNMWHAAGVNTTQNKRRAFTITFTKPFMKQQLDYSRSLGYDKVATMHDDVQQIVGYFSRMPTNLQEWYQKPENRFYRPGQD